MHSQHAAVYTPSIFEFSSHLNDCFEYHGLLRTATHPLSPSASNHSAAAGEIFTVLRYVFVLVDMACCPGDRFVLAAYLLDSAPVATVAPGSQRCFCNAWNAVGRCQLTASYPVKDVVRDVAVLLCRADCCCCSCAGLCRPVVKQNGLPLHFHEPHLPGTRCRDCSDDVCLTLEGCAPGKPQQGPWGEGACGCSPHRWLHNSLKSVMQQVDHQQLL